MDPWVIPPESRAKFDAQFNTMHQGGFVGGDKARELFLKSGLPPPILARIWALADMDADGKINRNEFAIALHLIQLKLRGIELPATLPPSLLRPPVPVQPIQQQVDPFAPMPAVAAVPAMPLMGGRAQQPQIGFGATFPPMGAPGQPDPFAANNAAFVPMGGVAAVPPGRPPLPTGVAAPQIASVPPPRPPVVGAVMPAVPTAVSPPLVNAVPPAAGLTEWAIPQASKLKYTQLFNTHDRSRSGFLTGNQARGLLLQSGLPQQVLAQIWALSDIDTDGRLSCDEFVLSMHLVDIVKAGDPLPAVLPLDLVPPSFRRKSATRSDSIRSTGSGSGDLLDDSLIGATTFEDKRRENFEKGQAELERRRQALLEQQRHEQEERRRKEREEEERREKIRLEQERKRQEELERQLQRQREIEMEKEEQRKRQQEQREAARREMERQRQLEWERQRIAELVAQKQRETEALSLLKRKKLDACMQSERSVRDLNEALEKVQIAKDGVTAAKESIDGMRGDRDEKMQALNAVKAQLKEIGEKDMALKREIAQCEGEMKQLKQAVAQKQNECERKMAALAARLDEMDKELAAKKQELATMDKELIELRQKKAALQAAQTNHVAGADAWGETSPPAAGGFVDPTQPAWGEAAAPAETWGEDGVAAQAAWDSSGQQVPGIVKYRALYAFEARNEDELSFMPGDIINVQEDPTGEPGWLGGELHGKTGWFPEAYVERCDAGVAASGSAAAGSLGFERTPLEGIAEEGSESQPHSLVGASENSSFTQVSGSGVMDQTQSERVEAQALFGWEAKKENHLTFSKGAIISVLERQDIWWYGEYDGRRGWFPKSHVKLTLGPFDRQSLSFDDQKEPSPPTEEAPTSTSFAHPAAATTTGAVAAGEKYVAMYPYDSAEPGDLCFQAGEIIDVTVKNEEWWTGSIGPDRTGMFPANYVRPATVDELPPTTTTTTSLTNGHEATKQQQQPSNIAETPVDRSETPVELKRKSTKKPEIVTVIAPYQASGPEQLTLEKGQLIQVRKKTEGGWWEGEVQVKGKKRQTGWFPASYVKVLAAGGSGSARNSPLPSGTAISASAAGDEAATVPLQDQVRAVFAFAAQHSDEISFEKNDLIAVTSREDPTWWRGYKILDSSKTEGLFPSNYVQPVEENLDDALRNIMSDSELEVREKKRQGHIYELLRTEESYVRDLILVYDVFYKPMRESRLLSGDELRIIFVNWHELIACSSKVLKALMMRQRQSVNGVIEMIGDVLCDIMDHLKPYIRFCSRQAQSMNLIQQKTEHTPGFKDLTQECAKNARVKGLTFTSFLLKPMQRITKYPLMVGKICEYTEEQHGDYAMLQEALSQVEHLCTQINEAVQQRENSERLEWCQVHLLTNGISDKLTFNSFTNVLGPRKFLHSGSLTKVKSGKELMGFLFNDFLLLAIPLKELNRISNVFTCDRAMQTQYRMYREPFFLNNCLVRDDGEEWDDTFRVCTPEYVCHVRAANANERILWMKKLKEASQVYRSTEARLIQEAADAKQQNGFVPQLRMRNGNGAGPGVGRLLVVVQQASNLSISAYVEAETYCVVSMGSHTHRTVCAIGNNNPQWNTPMQFPIKDINIDTLRVVVCKKERFSPDDFLGRAEVRMADVERRIRHVSAGPVIVPLKLLDTTSGEITLKLDIHIYHDRS